MLADTSFVIVGIGGPLIALTCGAVGSMLTARWRERRKGSTDVRRELQQLRDAYAGRKATLFDPHPPPGLGKRMDNVELVLGEHTMKLEGVQTSIDALISSTRSNGGNTRQLGDMVLLIAEKLGVDIPAKGTDDG